MSLSVQHSVVESFKFSSKNIRAVYIKDVGQCLISLDVCTAIGYDKESGIKAIQRLVPEKCNMRFGDDKIDMKEVDKNVHLHPDTVGLVVCGEGRYQNGRGETPVPPPRYEDKKTKNSNFFEG